MTHFQSQSAESLAQAFAQGRPDGLPPDWPLHPLVHEAHQLLARGVLQAIPPRPQTHAGRGIVICAGGHRLFTNAWVCVRMLRELGCQLPVQFWHLGASEMDERMRAIVHELHVECVDAETIAEKHPVRILNGWEVKPYAILHSPFREVILLDADNVPLYDPAFLLETPEFAEHGAIFWPDFGRLGRERPIWKICEVDYRDEPEFETGQIVIDKHRCWEALQLTMHYNAHSDFYFRHIHGDKDTFHLAFRRAGNSYAMPSRGIHPLDCTMCQHDFQGRRIFQHRNLDKWRLDGLNRPIAGFEHEARCRKYLGELRLQWHGRVHWNEVPSAEEATRMAALSGQRVRYERVGHDARELELRPDRSIGAGSASCERAWTIKCDPLRGMELFIFGDEAPTCSLREENGAWRGRWFRHERMPIVITARNGAA